MNFYRQRRRRRHQNYLENSQNDNDQQQNQNNYLDIGPMDNVCGYYGAKRFATENKSVCCANGQVQLPAIPEAPPPLKQFLKEKNLIGNYIHYVQKGAYILRTGKHATCSKVHLFMS